MERSVGKRFILIRHAPVVSDGLFYGSRDVACRCPTAKEIEKIGANIPDNFNLYVSSAKRCLTTAEYLFPNVKPLALDKLREQNFGSWEGIPYEKIPNIGTLSSTELGEFRPPEGESFNEMSLRVKLVFKEILEKNGSQVSSVIVAHAGTIRAVLSTLVGDSALSFQFDNLSISEFIFLTDGMIVNYLNKVIIQ